MSTTVPGPPALFLHFTTITDALLMVAAGIIGQSRTIVGAVYAVAAGGVYVPSTQIGGRTAMAGREGEEMVAILFTTPIAPDTVYVEEVTWHQATDLPVTDAAIIDLEDAKTLLDGSANLPN